MAARLRPSDPQRIVRALEVVDATGRSLADWQEQRDEPVLPPGPQVRRIVLSPDRSDLRARIAKRFEAMVAAGAVEEATALLARRLDPGLPVMKAIGVAELADHAAGHVGRSEAIRRAVTASRQYAKRQDTWFRHRFANWERWPSAEAALF
jgi:tRNA dimethylallyltransferase